MACTLISPAQEQLVSWLRPMTLPLGALTIAIDGLDYSGKSTLSRFLAWQLCMPVIETDLLLIAPGDTPNHDTNLLRRLVEMRHRMNRPVIVEGIFVLRLLDEINVEPEILICAECSTARRPGSWPQQFEDYRAKYPRACAPDYRFTW